MPLTQMEVLGYRGFQERGVLKFAVSNGEYGSGLTVITGPNNAGKSTILECLRARAGTRPISFTVGTRNAAVDSVEIKYMINDACEQIKSISKGSSESKNEGIDRNFKIFVLPSRRAFNPYFGKAEWSRDEYLKNSTLPSQRSSVIDNFEYRLFKTINNPEEFNKVLKEVLGFKPVWTIDRSDQGQYFLKFYNGKHAHSSDGMGEGIISIFAIVDSLYDSNPGDMVVIDEPELSLHPGLQKRLSNLFGKFSKDRQVVLSTHSPYFVDLQALANGGHLARVTTTEIGTKIHQLSEDSKTALKSLSMGNLYNPHVMGLDARELFFQEDCIVLTEGQEDVLLYPRVAEQIGALISGNFFGWGAGGAGNILHLCKILKDLGFCKVAALLDGNKIDEMNKLKDLFPEFLFVCIPADDIRTKMPRKATEKSDGLLDENLILRPELAPAMTKIFSSLSSYMKSPADGARKAG